MQDKFHSFIDHFAVSGGFANVSYCSNLNVYDDSFGDVNSSVHLGFGVSVNLSVSGNKQGNTFVDHSTSYAHKVFWHKATSAHINNYCKHLSYILLDILNSFMLGMRDCTGL